MKNTDCYSHKERFRLGRKVYDIYKGNELVCRTSITFIRKIRNLNEDEFLEMLEVYKYFGNQDGVLFKLYNPKIYEKYKLLFS